MTILVRSLFLAATAITGVQAQIVETGKQVVPPASSAAGRTSASWGLPDSIKVSVNIRYDRYAETVVDILEPRTVSGPELRSGAVLITGGTGENRAEDYQKVFAKFLLDHGFVVANVGYRPRTTAPAPASAQDSLKAARWFVDHATDYRVDPGRIITMG